MASLETQRLVRFLRSRGALVHEDLELFARSPCGTRGVFAIAPIRHGKLLIRLPRGAVLSACDGEDWMPEHARSASPLLRAALCLLREQSLGAASSWAPYLETLPDEYDTLENWTQAELRALSGTSVYEELRGLRDAASGDLVGPARLLWERSIAPIVAQRPDLWPDASVETFLRACAAVRTRGFYDTAPGGGGPYMLPAIDMLNHSCKGTATSLVVERDETDLVFSMEAERDIEAGEELTHMYDHLDDAQLLLTFGFVSSAGEGALPTTARLSLQAIIDATDAVARRCDLGWDIRDGWACKVEACTKLLAAHGGKVGVSSEEPLPDELLTAVLLLLLPRADFEGLLQGEESTESSAAFPRVPLLDRTLLRGEPELATAVVQAIHHLVRTTLRRYPDDQSLQPESSSTCNRRLQMAAVLRRAEQKALLKTQEEAVELLAIAQAEDSDASDTQEDEEKKNPRKIQRT